MLFDHKYICCVAGYGYRFSSKFPIGNFELSIISNSNKPGIKYYVSEDEIIDIQQDGPCASFFLRAILLQQGGPSASFAPRVFPEVSF
jgi:hypothetical protein